MKELYTGLFEDEISELLRELRRDDCILASNGAIFRSACMMCDDGIYEDGAGYFLQIDAYGTRSTVNRQFLINKLSHAEFCIYRGMK